MDGGAGGPAPVVLVSTYDGGHQPIGLASPAAFLERAGFRPVCLDLAVRRLDQEALDLMGRARLVAISVPMHTALALGLQVARRVRALASRPHLCFYGLHALPFRRQFLAAGADTVLGGEAEDALVALARALDNGGDAAVAVEAAPLRRLTFLAPARGTLPALPHYARLIVGDERRLAGQVEATRGCLHMCRHCPIPPVYGGRFFAVPGAVVAADIARQVAAGARHIAFADPDFLNGPRHALTLARALHAAHPEVTFSFTAKVEHILAHRDLFPALAQAGCAFVVSAVESLGGEVLRIFDKRHTAADIHEALRVVRGAGLSLRPTLVAFTPWTTLDDYRALCRFIDEEDLVHEVNPVQLAIRLLLPPGSLLLGRPELAPHLGPFDEAALGYRWTHPDPRMDALHQLVRRLVEEAASTDEAPARTFARVHEAAGRVAGHPAGRARFRPRRPPPPRLSEPWFC